MLSQAEAGPEALQSLLEASQELKVSTTIAHEKLTKLESRLTATKSAVDAQSSMGEAAMGAASDAGRAAAAVGARLDAESKRLTAYCNKATQPLARSAQVSCTLVSGSFAKISGDGTQCTNPPCVPPSVQSNARMMRHSCCMLQLNEVIEQMAALKATLAQDASNTKEELKFELMHEKSPQVSTLKGFLAQQVPIHHHICNLLPLSILPTGTWTAFTCGCPMSRVPEYASQVPHNTGSSLSESSGCATVVGLSRLLLDSEYGVAGHANDVANDV